MSSEHEKQIETLNAEIQKLLLLMDKTKRQRNSALDACAELESRLEISKHFMEKCEEEKDLLKANLDKANVEGSSFKNYTSSKSTDSEPLLGPEIAHN